MFVVANDRNNKNIVFIHFLWVQNRDEIQIYRNFPKRTDERKNNLYSNNILVFRAVIYDKLYN